MEKRREEKGSATCTRWNTRVRCKLSTKLPPPVIHPLPLSTHATRNPSLFHLPRRPPSPPRYAPDPYADKFGYLKSEPLDQRKLGFGSHDASKRSEFTLTVRTEQYVTAEHREEGGEKGGEEERGKGGKGGRNARVRSGDRAERR